MSELHGELFQEKINSLKFQNLFDSIQAAGKKYFRTWVSESAVKLSRGKNTVPLVYFLFKYSNYFSNVRICISIKYRVFCETIKLSLPHTGYDYTTFWGASFLSCHAATLDMFEKLSGTTCICILGHDFSLSLMYKRGIYPKDS